ncbi:hypothetical protein MASR2M39_32270 [Ignavibacteriales bacterium]
MNYLITYDLNKPGQNYNELYAAIRSYRNYHPLESVWFIKSNATATAIFNALHPHIDKNDTLFVCEITSNRSGWIPKDAWTFLDNA